MRKQLLEVLNIIFKSVTCQSNKYEIVTENKSETKPYNKYFFVIYLQKISNKYPQISLMNISSLISLIAIAEFHWHSLKVSYHEEINNSEVIFDGIDLASAFLSCCCSLVTFVYLGPYFIATVRNYLALQ